MRASRLLSILTTLQARGLVTAQALADEAQVSLRTIYRDIDALSAAGIPVLAERGAEGGYRLLDGYRVRLNGLSHREAESLFLGGLAGPAADLGLGAVMAAAQQKLKVALPADLRASAERMQARFHLDALQWFGEVDQPPHLQAVAEAVWSQRRLEVRYQSWKAEQTRRLEPLGLVLKGGGWYLAAALDGRVRTYRVSRILELSVLDERFDRPADFDLPAYWRAATQRLEAELHPGMATLRVSARGARLLAETSAPYARSRLVLGEVEDDEGWRHATLPVGSTRHAAYELLRLGPEVEVLAPPELRATMATLARQLSERYASAVPGDVGAG